MNPQQFAELERLFDQTRNLGHDERAEILDRECGDDSGLRARVERMLAHADANSDASLAAVRNEAAAAANAAFADPLADLPPGTVIDRFRIVAKCGEGGMGIVYEAEQLEPVQRRVALKLIKIGMDTREFVTRFESERQSLAILNHPGVARVLDAGATDQGRPFFVMDFVHGTPITRYCDEQKLTIDERLALFAKVCEAVQHAHQKGLIHRDLKPGNILVETIDGVAVPKVIDFGVAKTIDHDAAAETVFTRQGHIVGTPEYMSPEQAGAGEGGVDTRADIYALGVLLYELLTGVLPFEPEALRQASLAEMQRIVREVEPVKPSLRLSRVSTDGGKGTEAAVSRSTDIRSLNRRLCGELDWIVLKCLDKEPARRYPTASELAADVSRYLRHDPVVAGPPSASYRFRKFIRRNRGGVTAASLVAAALVAGFIGTTTGWGKARAEARRALAEKVVAESAFGFVGDLFESPAFEGSDIQVGTVLRQAREDMADSDYSKQVEAKVRQLLAHGFHAIGDYGTAVEELEAAAELYEKLQLPCDRAAVLTDLAESLNEMLRTDESLPLLDEVMTIVRAEECDWGIELDVLVNRSMAQYLRKDREGQLASAEAAVALAQAHGADHDREGLLAVYALATAHAAAGDFAAAVELYEDMRQHVPSAFGHKHIMTAAVLHDLGYCYERLDRLDDADRLAAEAVAHAREHLGESHPRLLTVMARQADLAASRGDVARASGIFQDTLDAVPAVIQNDEQRMGPELASLIYMLINRKLHLNQAEEHAQAAWEAYRRNNHDHSLNGANMLNRLNMCRYYRVLGKTEATVNEQEVAELQQELHLWQELRGMTNPITIGAFARFAQIMNAKKQYALTVHDVRPAYEALVGMREPNKWQGRDLASRYAQALHELGEIAEANKVLDWLTANCTFKATDATKHGFAIELLAEKCRRHGDTEGAQQWSQLLEPAPETP